MCQRGLELKDLSLLYFTSARHTTDASAIVLVHRPSVADQRGVMCRAMNWIFRLSVRISEIQRHRLYISEYSYPRAPLPTPRHVLTVAMSIELACAFHCISRIFDARFALEFIGTARRQIIANVGDSTLTHRSMPLCLQFHALWTDVSSCASASSTRLGSHSQG